MVKSFGTVGNIAKTTSLNVKVTAGSADPSLDPTNPLSPFHYVGYSAGSSSFQNAPAINGAAYAYGGAVSGAAGRNTLQVDYTKMLFPTYSLLTSIQDSTKSTYNIGLLTYDNSTNTYTVPMNANLSNVIISVNGNLNVADNNSFNNVSFFATGNIILGNTNFTGNNLMVSGNDFTSNNNCDFGNSVVVAYGSTSIANLNLNGTVITKGAAAYSGGANFTYNLTLIQTLFPSASNSITVSNWGT